MKNFRVRLVIVLAAALFPALGIWSEVNTWNRLVLSANNRLVETARTISLHTDDVLAQAEQSLTDLTLKAQASLGDEAATRRVLDVMQRLPPGSALLHSIEYVGAQGRLVGSTLTASARETEVSNRAEVAFHQAKASSDSHIGVAARSATDGGWLLPISRRINGPAGDFGGVMIVTIDLDRVVRFMESFNLGGESAFFLMHGDGSILMRFPLKSQRMTANLADVDFFTSQAALQREGNHEYLTPSGKETRLSGFAYSEQTGVTAIATRSRSAIFHHWVVLARYPWLAVAAAYLLAVAITFRWLRQIRLREIGEQKVAAREAEFRLIANTSTDVIEKITMNGRRDYVSPAAARIFEQPPEILVGTNVMDAQDEQGRKAWEAALAKLRAGSDNETIVVQRTRSDGIGIWLESILTCVLSEGGESSDSIVVVTRDVTRQELAKKELDTLAITDELTGLFNKRYFRQQLRQLFTQDMSLSLLLIDLDRFKLFNDKYGHLAGDGCLRDVALALRETLEGSQAIAARYGGEELAVLLPDCDESASLVIAENLRARIEALRILHVNNKPAGVVTASIGAATVIKEHQHSADALILAADQALYQAKHLGRNQVVSASGTVDFPQVALGV